MDEVFYEVFSNLPRQGPGDVCISLEALNSIPFSDSEIRMADIGCGTGFPTLYLAQHIKGQILAIDNYQAFAHSPGALYIVQEGALSKVTGSTNQFIFRRDEVEFHYSYMQP